jgi:cell wall-associated NlpC family hydrolase
MSFSSFTSSRLRRALAGVAGTIAAICWVAGPADAGIAGNHHSSSVVSNAFWALTAHDTFSMTGKPGDFAAYVSARNLTADAVAAEMALDPVAVRDAWARADMPHQKAVMAALAELGKPYRYATSDPAVGFDCSGLTAYAWLRAGVDIPNQSSAQIRASAARDQASAMAGDLVQYPGHVMMYLGVGDAIVHAVNHSDDVELDFFRRNVRFGNPIG